MHGGSAHHAGAPLRLSPRQEAFWLADALFPDAPCNHVVVRLVVEGALDEARCAGAFTAVVAANDACRFAFDPAGGPLLRPSPVAPALVTADVADDAAAARWRSVVLRPRFGVGEPLSRTALLRSGPQRREFVLVQHHVVTDSSSCLVFVERLASAYAGDAVGATGAPLRNRDGAHARTLGLLMAIVPNRVAVAPPTTMRALLADVQAEVARVRPHRGWTVPARQARCDVMLNVHPAAPTSFAGLPCRYEPTLPAILDANGAFAAAARPWSARESITVQAHRHGAGPYEVSLDANCGLFDAELATRALGRLTALLELGRRDSDARVGELAILGDDDARCAVPRRPRRRRRRTAHRRRQLPRGGASRADAALPPIR
jgi:hypothetical protein